MHNILAAVDCFPQDEPVLARAVEIASVHGATLTVVHVIDIDTGGNLTPTERTLIQRQAWLAARERVETAVTRQTGEIAKVEIRIETGSPALRLIELSAEIDADLVVMRAHQRDSIIEKILGSTSDRVIRAAGAPVLVIKRPVVQPYQSVVVATDTSDNSAAGVSFVAALFPQVALNLVHVVHVPPQFEEVMLRAGCGQARMSDYRDALIGQAKSHMRKWAERLAKRPRQGATRVMTGIPTTVLRRVTRGPRVDLIALGAGDTSLIRRALLGSITRRLLRDAACDVLIYRPQAQD